MIDTGKGMLFVRLNNLEALSLLAERYGFPDVDVKPGQPYEVVCSGKNTSFTCKGEDLESATNKAITRLWEGGA